MSLTTIVGAFLTLVPRAGPKPEPEKSREKTLVALTLELEGYVGELERELSAERNLTAHWIGEAGRFARQLREYRAYQPQQDPQQALQQAQAHAEYLQAMMQAQAQQAQLAGLGQQTQYAQGFCNCVPSRSQVWGAQHGLVQQLNDNGRE